MSKQETKPLTLTWLESQSQGLKIPLDPDLIIPSPPHHLTTASTLIEAEETRHEGGGSLNC